MVPNTSHTWGTALKSTVEHAYSTGRLVDIRNALEQIMFQLGDDRGKHITIGILRTFTVETLLEYFNFSLAIIPCVPKIILGELDNIEQELLDSSSELLQSSPDIVMILWRIEELHPRLIWGIDDMSLDQRCNACNMVIERIQNIIMQYQGDASLFLTTLFVPPHFTGLLHDQHRGFGIVEIVGRINLFLYEQASAKKIRLFDLAQWVMDVGGRAMDKKMDFFARQPIAAQYALSFADGFARVVRPFVVPQSKVLAVDLDNTLWGGVLGEDGVDHLKIGNDYPGWIYWRIQQVLLGLKKRGILLVLLSKNNLEDVEEAFSVLNEMPLQLSDFSALKINWVEKHKNILEVANELNLGLDSFVFLDDQPFEQEQMQQSLPDVKVLRSSKDPLNLLNSLSTTYFFDAFAIGHEDLIRSKDYEKQVKRKILEKSMSREDFLFSLELKAVVRPVTDATLQRSVQMLAKTNQFNLTTKRHNSKEIRRMMDNDENVLLTLSLSDKFGDQGIVGLCIVLINKDEEMVIDSFLMSCRALGRGAEDVLWSALLEQSNKRRGNLLRATYLPSKKNMQVSGFFERQGMEVSKENSCGKHYTMHLPFFAEMPDWINVLLKE